LESTGLDNQSNWDMALWGMIELKILSGSSKSF
jgi:hypothetical protein